MYYVSNYLQWHVIPEKLTLNIYGMYAHMYNSGKDFSRHYNVVSAQAAVEYTLGRFTMLVDYNSGWRFEEGNSRGVSHPYADFQMRYRVPMPKNQSLAVGLYANHLFTREYRGSDNLTFDRLWNMNSRSYSRDEGNLFGIALVWNISLGRHFEMPQQRIQGQKGDASFVK